MRKLKYSEIKIVREQLLKEQDNRCALSGIKLTNDRAVLDHAHGDGKIRKVLDRGVNALLGKIENGLLMNGITLEMLENICLNLVDYIKNSEQEILHPTYRNPEEKKAQAKIRAAKKRKAIKESKKPQ